LSNGKFSIMTGSHGTHENFTTGCADLGGYTHKSIHAMDQQIHKHNGINRLKMDDSLVSS